MLFFAFNVKGEKEKKYVNNVVKFFLFTVKNKQTILQSLIEFIKSIYSSFVGSSELFQFLAKAA